MEKDKPICTCCTGAVQEDLKMLQIKGVLVGVIGLEEAFLNVMQRGIKDEEEVKEALLEEVSKRNYVPQNYEVDYKEALFRAYCSFLSEKEREKT